MSNLRPDIQSQATVSTLDSGFVEELSQRGYNIAVVDGQFGSLTGQYGDNAANPLRESQLESLLRY
jgi:hypothetical protein